MKKTIMLILLLSAILSRTVQAQSEELQQLALNIEKLAQFRKILSDMKKGYEILNGGYNTIKDLSEGNFSLHKTFLDGLMAVSPSVQRYKKAGDIISYQKSILQEYKSALKRFKSSGFFNSSELGYMERTYDNLLKKSLQNLDELAMVITAGKLRMSDDERLQAIDRIYDDMEDKLVFLRHFNNSSSVLAAQRAKEQNDVRAMRRAYGIKN